jgi:hypothetical protein
MHFFNFTLFISTDIKDIVGKYFLLLTFTIFYFLIGTHFLLSFFSVLLLTGGGKDLKFLTPRTKLEDLPDGNRTTNFKILGDWHCLKSTWKWVSTQRFNW